MALCLTLPGFFPGAPDRLRRAGGAVALLAALAALAFPPDGCWAAAPGMAEAPAPLRLTLLDALGRALAGNGAIRLQTQQVVAAQGALQEAAGAFDPTLSASAARSRDRAPLNLANQQYYLAQGYRLNALESESTTLKFGLDVPFCNGLVFSPQLISSRSFGTTANLQGQLPQNVGTLRFSLLVPLQRSQGGSLAAVEAAAEMDLRAGQADLCQSVADNLYGVATAYWQWVAAVRNLEIAREAEQGMAGMVADNRKLIEADEVPAASQDLLLADQLEKQNARLAAEQAQVEARLALGKALGLGFRELARLEPAEEFPDLALTVPDPSGSGPAMLRLALSRRADLAAAEHRLEAARIRARVAEENLRPQLDLTLGAGYAGLSESAANRAMVDALSNQFTGPNVSVSLSYQMSVNNGAARGRLRQSLAAADVAGINREELEKTIARGVEAALTGLSRSALQWRQSVDVVGIYRRALENERTRHRLGSATILDVLNVNSRLLAARQANVSYHLNYLSNLARLSYETGSLVRDPDGDGNFSVAIAPFLSLPVPGGN